MKKLAFLIVWIACFSTTGGNAQTLPTKIAAARLLMNQAGYKVSDVLYCNLQEGKECYSSRTFYGNLDYVILAVAEEGVDDLDLFAYNSNGRKHSEDVTFGEVPALSVNLLFAEKFTLFLKNVDSYSSTYTYSTAILIGYK